MAARRNLAGLCRWLLRFGTNVDRTDILDRTPLHLAARDGATDTARLLIAHGADLDAKDWQGRTPLDLAESDDSETHTQVIREAVSLRHAERVKALKMLTAKSKKNR